MELDFEKIGMESGWGEKLKKKNHFNSKSGMWYQDKNLS